MELKGTLRPSSIHPHGHFGGVKGFGTDEDIEKKTSRSLPKGFLEHAVSENVFAGTARPTFRVHVRCCSQPGT